MNHLERYSAYATIFISPAITGANLHTSQAEMSDSGTKLLAQSFVNKIHKYLKYKIK